jgi:cellulose synthase/poly-beta-1,6-N-acetylglucosamine synthase-like glycosyltransferase
MDEILAIAAWALAAPVILALVIFSAEVAAGLIPLRRILLSGQSPGICILIPAHNESSGIAATLSPLMSLSLDRIRVVVVADNCNDDTAERARTFDCEVVVRHNSQLRGKGYALDYGRDHLRHDPPECVIILDADCRIDAASIVALAGHCRASGRPCQAMNVLEASPRSAAMVQISNFAFWVKNVVRQRGSTRLGGAALLTGTGVAFPWPLFADLPLATDNVVEDLGLGIWVTRSGIAPLYLEQARVVSQAASDQATVGQRTRWELGFVQMARRYSLPSIWSGIVSGNRKLFQLGLHLLVPPLAMLFALAALVLVLTCLSSILTNDLLPTAAVAALLCTTTILILVCWAAGGHHWLSSKALIRLPLYIVWKIPVYLKLFRGEKPQWTRTDRDIG